MALVANAPTLSGLAAGWVTGASALSAFERSPRAEAIAAYLREKPSTLAEPVAHRFVYPRSHRDIYIDDVERRTIEQHLDSLVASGSVSAGEGRYRALP